MRHNPRKNRMGGTMHESEVKTVKTATFVGVQEA